MTLIENPLSIIAIISFVIALLGLPFILLKYRNILRGKLENYNRKERVVLVTSITSIILAGALCYLAVAQFVNSIPTLFYIQTLPANPINYAFQDLMLFGVVSGIICSFLGYYLLRVSWKELRIVLSTNSFRKK